MTRLIELDKQKECVSWGIQGESGATTLVVDVADFQAFGEGTAAVIFQRQDGHPYIHNFFLEGEKLFITLTQIDTQIVGKCELTISWAIGSRIMKKKNYRSFIMPSALEDDLPLTEEAIVALDNLKQYVEEAKNLVEDAQKLTRELVFVSALPEIGEPNKIYIEETSTQIYYWDGTDFIAVAAKPSEIIFGGDALSTF